MRPPFITLLLALALALGAGLASQASAQGGADPAPAATTTERATTTPPAQEPAPSDNESLPIPEGSSGPVSVGGGMGGTALRLLLGLLVVVALIVGVWQLMKRVQRNRYPALVAGGGGGGDLIDVVATTPLGPNRALHLVRVGDAVVLVGATEQSVQAVTTLDEASAAIITRALGPGGPGEGDRARATQTARGTGAPLTMMDRVRAMTVRR